MMEAVLPRSWKEQFERAAAIRQEDIAYREKLTRLAARQRQFTEEQRITTEKRDAQAWAMIESALAPPARVAEFRVKLDTYDAKTVEALIENQEAIERVQKRLDDMRGKAHLLPDGRRVFKTMDGEKVFDEHGEQLSRDLIDPSGINDRKPTWEAFKGVKEEGVRLNNERQQLLDYQDRLDRSRERLDAGDLTERELKGMEDDLRAGMPEAVRAKVEPDTPKSTATPTQKAPSMPDGMDALMRQTGLGPSPMAGPG